MSTRNPIARGFTLVELLAVIAIIALLVTLLVPFLQRGRQFALRAVCGTNMRSISVAGLGFAAEHEGRGPGGGARANDGSSVAWADVLNVEFFKEYRVQRMGYARGKNRLYCPNMKYWGSLYVRGHFWNRDAAGGPGWGSNPREGPYGKAIDPVPQHLSDQYAPFIYGALGWYCLGARLDRFPDPGRQYLLLETEAGDDEFGAMTGTIQFNTNPPWLGVPTGGGYGFAYRHVLPMDESMYKTLATANFLFVDGHVETYTPPETVNKADRFLISP